MFSCQRSVKATTPSKPSQPASDETEPAQVEPVKPKDTMSMVARVAAQLMSRRLEEREKSRPPYTQEDSETDVDRLFPRAEKGSAREISKDMHLVARQAAMQYIQRLKHADGLFSPDSIPRALRGLDNLDL